MTDGRVVVAMSGGVDSSVAAALLAERGLDVVGLTLRLISCEDPGTRGSCCDVDAVAGARAVAGTLGAPHYVVDVEGEFDDGVLRPAWDEYDRGHTPNPCVHCNSRIKWTALLRRADALGARWVATGHHARRAAGPGGVELLRGVDPDKDQSYFLCRLTRSQLERTLLPVGELTKGEVRARARALGLATADREESQDACLAAADGGFAEALRRRFGADARPGPLVGDGGRPLGHHPGVHRFTVGQRRGLGVALGRPAYVRAIDGDRVCLTTRSHRLDADGLEVSGARWLAEPPPAVGDPVQVQIRYRHRPVGARVEAVDGGRVRVRFERPQRAVTPGQAAVFYNGARVLGGGWIDGDPATSP